MDDSSSMTQTDKAMLADYDRAPPPDEMMIKANFRSDIMKLLKEIRSRVTSTNEILCTEAVITVFETVDDLDFLNKRAVFVYVRDISGLTPKQLSVAMSSIRKHYRGLVKNGGEFDIF